MNFGTSVTLLGLTATSITVSGTGTCAGNAGVTTVNLSMSGTGTLSCIGGTGAMTASLNWTPPFPGAQVGVPVAVVAGPLSVQAVIVGTGFDATADWVWTSPSPLVSCLTLQDASSVSLSGTMVYAAQ